MYGKVKRLNTSLKKRPLECWKILFLFLQDGRKQNPRSPSSCFRRSGRLCAPLCPSGAPPGPQCGQHRSSPLQVRGMSLPRPVEHLRDPFLDLCCSTQPWCFICRQSVSHLHNAPLDFLRAGVTPDPISRRIRGKNLFRNCLVFSS